MTSSASIQNVNRGGTEVFTASSVSSTCTASESGVSGSTTIANGSVRTSEGNPDVEGDETVVTIPTNPAPNYIVNGQLETVGDSFQWIFNERTIDGSGGITVYAAHLRLLGPVAVGDLYIGKSYCDVTPAVTTTSSASTSTTTGSTPTLAVNDLTIAETDTAQTFTFTITRSGSTTGASSVTWNTLDSSAVSPADFVAVGPTTVNFAAGQATKNASVTVKGDNIVEVNEAFLVRLSNPVGATIADNTGLARINNDDVSPFSVHDVTVTEGNSGTTLATFNVTRSGDVQGPASVKWQTINAQATAGTDYVAVAPTLINFAAGETSKTATATVTGDTAVEANETFLIRLTAPTLATIFDATGVVRITNDDVASLVVNDVTVTEGNAGTTQANLTISRTGAVAGPASVNWATANGTAIAPGDYTAVGWTTVNFAPGETAKTVSVTVRGDTAVEGLESFQVRLASPVWATIVDGSGLGRISNDDVANLSVNDVTVFEGNAGTSQATFTITRSGAIGGASSVQWYTTDGTAVAPGDYVAVAPATVTFAAGETTKTVSVSIRGDATVEANETFSLRLGSPTNASVVDGSGLGRITNDD